MGQETSVLVDENTPPETLESRTLDAIAKYIKDGRAKKIVLMVGAGISTSAGIPDFRSPDTGLYANLARLNLPFAEAVFDISYFRQSPEPFYALAQELYPGKFRPTITHSFIYLLERKGLLLKCFSQNVDCLEREAGVSGELMVEAHGSFASQSCIDCKESQPDSLMHKAIAEKSVPRCKELGCDGLVKPDIVFFGEQLPSSFFFSRTLPREADLCIVMGTSLAVQPFASLPGYCAEGVPRLLINLEVSGSLGSRADDVLLLGDCDAGVRKLAAACGWLEELEALWEKTAAVAATDLGKTPESKEAEKPSIEDEVEKLTREVNETLKIAENHRKQSWGLTPAGKEKTKAPVQEDKGETQGGAGDGSIDHPTKEVDNEKESQQNGEEGLSHVFPHLSKTPAL